MSSDEIIHPTVNVNYSIAQTIVPVNIFFSKRKILKNIHALNWFVIPTRRNGTYVWVFTRRDLIFFQKTTIKTYEEKLQPNNDCLS